MGFFNELGKKTAKTTNKIAKEAKLKIRIKENKEKVKELYKEIGTIVYQKHLREEKLDIKEELNEECYKLDELSKEIEDARMAILKLNDKKLCIKCFAEIEEDMQFCPKCGKKQNEEKTILENAEEKLKEAEISEKNIKEVEIVKEELKEKNEQ